MWEKLKNELYEGRTLMQFGFLQILGYIANMIVPLLLAKIFSEGMFGQYSMLEMIISFFVILFVTCPRIPFIVYANQERVKTGGVQKSFFISAVFLAAGIIAFPIICLIFGKGLMKLAGIDRWVLLFTGFAFLGLALKDVLTGLFMGFNKRIKSAFAEAVFWLLTVGIIIWLYTANLVSFKTVFLTFLVSSAAVCFIFLWFINFKQVLPPRFDRAHFSRTSKFVLWTVFGVLAAYLIDWGGVAILRGYASFEDMGTFNFANKFFKGFMALVYMLPNYFLPFISENLNDQAKIRYYLYHKRPVIFSLGVMCLIAAYFVIPYFITVVYGEKYLDAVPVVRILLIGVVVFLYAMFYAPLIGAMERYKFAQITLMISSVLNIAFNLLLIPRIGTYGAAIATVISYVFLMLAYEGYFRLKLKKIVLPKPSGQ